MLSKERNKQKKDMNIQILEQIHNQLKNTREIRDKISHRLYRLLQFEETDSKNWKPNLNSKFDGVNKHFTIVNKLD